MPFGAFSFLYPLGFTDPVNQVKQAWTDFGDTAQLSLIVPEGVTWRSASGVFLVPAPVAIPAARGCSGRACPV